MATVIGSSPEAERGMPWLLQAVVHPAGSKLTAQCTLSWRVCCPEAVMAFSIIKEGHLIYNQPFAASCPGSLLWGCNTHINGREAVHKTSLHPPCEEFAPFRGLKTPLCCSRHFVVQGTRLSNYKPMLKTAGVIYLLLPSLNTS